MSIDMNKPADDAAGDTVTAVGPATAPYQIPRVNLMPPEIEAQRNFKKTQAILGGAVLGVVGLLAGGYLWASIDAGNAAEELAAEQATTASLNTEKTKYAQVTEVKNEVEAVRGARQVAMVQDVLWTAQLDQITAEMPSDVVFKSMAMGFDADLATDPNPLADPSAVGTLTVSGTAPNHTGVAHWLEAEAQHPGFTDQYYTNSEYSDADGKVHVEFSSTIRFTPEIYSGRYEPGGSKAAETGEVR